MRARRSASRSSRSWDNALFRRELGELPEALQEAVRQALREFLDL